MTAQINTLIKQSHANWDMWNDIGASVRSDLVIRWADELAEDPSLGVMSSKMAKHQAKQALSLIGEEKLMPGPTGETNELYTAGRGVFVMTASDELSVSGVVGQLATALVAGNTVIISLPEKHAELASRLQSTLLKAGFPKSVVQLADFSMLNALIEDTSTAGVAFVGNAIDAQGINRQLSNRTGLLAQLIAETDLNSLITVTDSHFVLRFITEKTRTINITAVGGNATLLELGSGDH
jgi:delta 1-pyrroline-5-carboxylate dehydrogenase